MLRDPSISEWWEAVRGRIDGSPPATPVDRMIVAVSRVILAASFTFVTAVATLVIELVR